MPWVHTSYGSFSSHTILELFPSCENDPELSERHHRTLKVFLGQGRGQDRIRVKLGKETSQTYTEIMNLLYALPLPTPQ